MLLLADAGVRDTQAAGDGLFGDAVRRTGRSLSFRAGAGAARSAAACHRHRHHRRGLSADLVLHRRRIQRDLRGRDGRHGGDADDGRQERARRGDPVRARRALPALLRGHGLSRAAARGGDRLGLAARRERRPRHSRALRACSARLHRRCGGFGRDDRRLLGSSALPEGAVDQRRFLAEHAVRHPAGRLRDLRRGRPAAAILAAGQGTVHRSRRRCRRCLPCRRGGVLVHPPSILYPPSHYVARQAAGILLAVLLGGMWLHAGRRRDPPAVLADLARASGRRGGCSRSSRR